MADRVHASAIRSKLLQLRQTSDPSLKRQTSVAAGKNANSARDKRVNVLTAGDLALRIHDLSAMIEKLAMAIDAIQAADQSIFCHNRVGPRSAGIGQARSGGY
jgi:hypothetical protein